MKVIEYIKANGLETLKANLGVEYRLYDDRVVLNYSQIESPKFDEVVRECRGLILSYPDLEVMSVTFNRFFNYGEDPNSDNFNVLDAIAFEKIDGSLMPVFFDGTKWQVATRGTAFAEGETRLGEKTFREVFEMALGGKVEDVFKGMPENLVYVFEMTSQFTRVVKKYDTCIYPLMIKDKVNMVEYWEPHVVREMINGIFDSNTKMRFPNTYKFNSFDEVLRSMKDLDTFDEGYVCVKNNGNGIPWRLKVKSPSYLAIAHIRGNGELSTKRLISLVFMNEHEEYLATFEEDRVIFQPYIDAYNRILEDVNAIWHNVKNISDQKEFAMQVKDRHCSGILFGLKKGKTLTQILDGMTLSYKEGLIKKYILD